MVINTCTSFTNFLDLQCIFLNVFSGGINIFLAVGSIAYLLFASALRLPLGAVGAGFVLLGLILSPISNGFLVVLLIFGFIFIGISVSQLFQR